MPFDLSSAGTQITQTPPKPRDSQPFLLVVEDQLSRLKNTQNVIGKWIEIHGSNLRWSEGELSEIWRGGRMRGMAE
jgi:hypothetical protein